MPDESARRARAAIAFSGLDYREIEKATGFSDPTLRRITSRKSPRRTSLEELWAIADACGVPRSFMEEGFAEGGPAPEERLEAVEHQLRTQGQQLKAIEERLGSLTSVGGPWLADALKRDVEPDAAQAEHEEPSAPHGSPQRRRRPRSAPGRSA